MNPETSLTMRQRPAGTSGRGRDAGRDTRILDAVLDLVSEQGPGAISMEAIAARAHVGKSTVYRRWGSLPDLLADAVDTITFPGSPSASTGNVRDDLVTGITAASGCMDARRQRIISALLNTGKDQTELVDALRIRFVNSVATAIATAVQENSSDHPLAIEHEGEYVQVHPATGDQWPFGSTDLAVVVGLLTSLPHITGHPLDRADFERIIDEALLPLWSTRRVGISTRVDVALDGDSATRPPSDR